MPLFQTLLAALAAALLLSSPIPALAAELTVVFSGNTWGYLKPCPT